MCPSPCRFRIRVPPHPRRGGRPGSPPADPPRAREGRVRGLGRPLARSRPSNSGAKGLPHLALVDILLPGLDGVSLARRLQEWSDLPIVMLTSVDEEETVVQAIEAFAEDYIRKPFNPREMVARIERVFRRIGDFGYALQPVIQVDERLAVDFAHQRALVDGRPVPLTSTETKLLYVLMRNAGRVVATDFLLRRLWPRTRCSRTRCGSTSTGCGQDRARALRPRYVVTERGTGYRFPRSADLMKISPPGPGGPGPGGRGPAAAGHLLLRPGGRQPGGPVRAGAPHPRRRGADRRRPGVRVPRDPPVAGPGRGGLRRSPIPARPRRRTSWPGAWRPGPGWA